ncbi:MAG: ABC transporter permease [Gammaproteobacteria bacterium]|nr:ABC transporter permease [Gammaproteobacteria bacterium]
MNSVADVNSVVQSPVEKQGKRLLVFPGLMIGIFFLIPFLMIIAVSFAHQLPEGYHEQAFELKNYARFFRSTYVDIAIFSMFASAFVAIVCVIIGFPFTYFVTRLKRRHQVFWLVYILAQLSLSEVLIAFSWQVLLSRTAGIGNMLHWLGIVEKSFSLYPSLGGVLVALVYLVLPFSFLLLYPTISRLDPEVTEASRTLGASPLKTFFLVVLPILRGPIITTGITMFVFTLGAILVPQVLGRPSHWTLSVHITDQAIFQSNLPFASALAIYLLIFSMSLVLFTTWLNRRSGAK